MNTSRYPSLSRDELAVLIPALLLIGRMIVYAQRTSVSKLSGGSTFQFRPRRSRPLTVV
ncbi:MAG TPA: hypothetical protein VF299_04825 [Mycobacterium sp.]